MNWLCRLGWHWWEETRLVTAEDIVAVHYDDDVCTRCGKLRNPQYALEAYYMMRANLRSRNFRYIVHPSLHVSDAASNEGVKNG